MPGPLPQAQQRRRNEPTIPTTNLPAAGRVGPLPKVPSWVTLGRAGKAWWRWAWSTPQAVAWSAGHVDALARRAALEDDLAVLADADGLVLADASFDEVKRIVSALKSLACGKLAVVKEQRELDDRFGLTPKAMAALRWSIVADEMPQQPALTVVDDRWKHLGA